MSLKNSWNADVIVDRTIQGNEGRANYRDVALYFQDEDNIIGTSFMPYVQNVAGLTGVNYRAEPYLHREEAGCSLGRMFQPCEVDNPQDPVQRRPLKLMLGDKVRIHVFGASSEQNGMFTVEKHEWPIEPFLPGADMISTVEFSGSEGLRCVLAFGWWKMVIGWRLCVEQWPVAVFPIWAMGISPGITQHGPADSPASRVRCLQTNKPNLMIWECLKIIPTVAK